MPDRLNCTPSEHLPQDKDIALVNVMPKYLALAKTKFAYPICLSRLWTGHSAWSILTPSAVQAASDGDAETAYLRVGALCDAIKAELNNDLKIHEANILPHFINLPQVTAGEYCRVSLLINPTYKQYKEVFFERRKRIQDHDIPQAWPA